MLDNNMATTMKVVEVFKRNKKKYFKVECPTCLEVIEVRSDAVKAGGYKEQRLCRKCSYIERDGKDLKGYTVKYPMLYNTFSNMLKRCYVVSSSKYHNYGAKGVTVHEAWKDNFIAFVDWALAQGFTYEELKKLELDKDFLCEKKGVSPAQYGPDTCLYVSKHFNNVLQPKKADTSSEYIGVNWGKSTNRWEWGLRLSDGKRKRGYGKSELGAAQQREKYIIDNNLSHRRNNV